jgi:hypothetical protein
MSSFSPAQLASIRDRLRAARDTCVLFDTPHLVHSLETLNAQMQAARLAGTLPRPDLFNLDLYHDIASAEDIEAVGALDTAAYHDHYRQRIADLDSVFPVRPDSRIWAPTAPGCSR